MQQVIGIRMNGLPSQPWQLRIIEQHRAPRFGVQRRHMTQVALRLVKVLLPLHYLRIVHIAPGRYTQRLQVKIHILHVLRAYVQLIIRQPHHTTLTHLALPFTNLLRIPAVGSPHVARETQLHSQVGMLRLVARQSQAPHSPFDDVVTPPADAIFGVIAFCRQRFNLHRIQCHHLPHAHVAKRNAHRAKQILRLDLLRIPFGYGVHRPAKLVSLSIGKRETLFDVSNR